MTLPDLHARPAGISGAHCSGCEAPLAFGQRYCVECGARRGPLPSKVVAALQAPVNTSPILAEPPLATDEDLLNWADGIEIPAAWQAAAAIIALLGFGVIAGTVSPGRSLASGSSYAYVQPPAASASAGVPATTPAPAPAASAPADAAVVPGADAVAAPAVDDTASSKPSTDDTAATTPQSSTPASTNGLPPVKHVFMIVLSGHGADDAFGAGSPSPYLATTLKGQGELLSNYYAVAGSPLANGVALISGQGPTPQTTADCPTFGDITPASPGDNGQVIGAGCVYPAATRTIGDQLSQDGETYKAYVEDMGAGGSEQAKTCRHPKLGAADDGAAPTTGDGYVTWRNPFSYFHSVIDAPSCDKTMVGLDQLVPDLSSDATTPSLSYIVPSRCNDGSTDACAPGATPGLASTDTFLRIVVPEIMKSPAYQDGGLIAITFDGAPQTGAAADTTGCCDTPAYPNLPTTPTPATTPAATDGTTATTPAPADGTTATTPAPADGTTATTPAAAGTTPSAPVATTPAPIIDPNAEVGGGKVGLLLLSQYVKAGSTNLVSNYNHYSLLASIENLFSLDKLGYAAVPTLPTFDVSIYNHS